MNYNHVSFDLYKLTNFAVWSLDLDHLFKNFINLNQLKLNIPNGVNLIQQMRTKVNFKHYLGHRKTLF